MTSTSASDLTDDAFLGGRLRLLQPRSGYRAGVDPVLLAAAVPAEPGQSVLELGCGTGTALYCLSSRIPGLRLTGVELQSDYADLARENATRNHITTTIHTADLRHLPHEITAQRYDHVIANPPYYQRNKGTGAADAGRDTALGGDTTLADWVRVAAKRVAPKGHLTLIQSVDRLPELLTHLPRMLGSVIIQPLSGRINRPPDRIILQARHGGRAPFRLCVPLVLHEGTAHPGDKPHYTAQIEAVLRDASELSIQC